MRDLINLAAWPIVVVLSGTYWATPVCAQLVIPEAGQLLERVRPPLPPLNTPESSEKKEIPPPKNADETRLRVMQIRITGSTVFSEDELHDIVADAQYRELTLTQLQTLAERITAYYRERGYLLARAIVPAQNINSGTIDLMVIEGRLGRIIERNNDVVGGAAMEPLGELKNGEVAQDQTLERSLLLLSDIPGVKVSSTLVPGSLPGTSDLIVDVQPGSTVTGSIDIDRNGDRFSGLTRTGGSLNINNPLGLGDQAIVRGKFSEGLRYLFADYHLPVSSAGMRMGVSASGLNYELGDTLASLGYKGHARTVSVYAIYPITRSRRSNMFAELQADRIRLEDQITVNDFRINKDVNLLTAALNGDWIDNWSGSGNWLVQYQSGHLALDAETAQIDALSAKSAGNFSKLVYALRRLHAMGPATSLLLSVNGQIANKNLDTSQKMSLGGAYAVRAYAQGEALGDQGYVATAELFRRIGMSLPGIWQASVFIDHGAVTVSKEPWLSAVNQRTLTGGGFGLTVNLPGNWSVRSSIAWPMGSEQSVSNQDRSSRGWIQMAKAF